MRYTVVLSADVEEGGYVAECPAIPGCISEGDSIEDALANIREAIEGCLESLAARNEPMPTERLVLLANVKVDSPTWTAA